MRFLLKMSVQVPVNLLVYPKLGLGNNKMVYLLLPYSFCFVSEVKTYIKMHGSMCQKVLIFFHHFVYKQNDGEERYMKTGFNLVFILGGRVLLSIFPCYKQQQSFLFMWFCLPCLNSLIDLSVSTLFYFMCKIFQIKLGCRIFFHKHDVYLHIFLYSIKQTTINKLFCFS